MLKSIARFCLILLLILPQLSAGCPFTCNRDSCGFIPEVDGKIINYTCGGTQGQYGCCTGNSLCILVDARVTCWPHGFECYGIDSCSWAIQETVAYCCP